jgi:hypothetical protein
LKGRRVASSSSPLPMEAAGWAVEEPGRRAAINQTKRPPRRRNSVPSMPTVKFAVLLSAP